MNTITHALLPVIAAGICARSYRAVEDRKGAFTIKRLIALGVFGAAPDLLNPHLSLDARYSSWSHSIWFWALLTVVMGFFSSTKRKICPMFLTMWSSAGYLTHIICDAVSGGIAWNYPFSHDIVGAYYVDPVWWIPLDILLFLFAYGLFRAAPRIKESKTKEIV